MVSPWVAANGAGRSEGYWKAICDIAPTRGPHRTERQLHKWTTVTDAPIASPGRRLANAPCRLEGAVGGDLATVSSWPVSRGQCPVTDDTLVEFISRTPQTELSWLPIDPEATLAHSDWVPESRHWPIGFNLIPPMANHWNEECSDVRSLRGSLQASRRPDRRKVDPVVTSDYDEHHM